MPAAERSAPADGGWAPLPDAARLPPLPLLEDALQASVELQELCRLQVQLLTSALTLSLQAALSSSTAGSVGDSADDDSLRQQLLEASGLRASVYCRAPGSLHTGKLQLQLVAASGEDGASGGASTHQQQPPPAQRFLFLGQDGAGSGSSLQDQEQWILEQPVIMLPDSGGLVLPLAHNGFLVGLLVVEHGFEDGSPLAGAAAADAAATAARAAAAAGAAAGARAAGDAASGGSGSTAPGMPQPPTCLLFRSAELQHLKQTAAVLSLACAMDMRAALERVGAAVRQRQASALVQAVSGQSWQAVAGSVFDGDGAG